MDEIDLPVARQLVLDGAAHQIFLKGRDRGLNRQAVPRRRFDQRHVAQPHQRHVQRPRNRRGGERKRIDILAHFLQPLFVRHSEALFFVDDEQSQVRKFHVLRKQAMRANHNVYFPGFEIGQNLLLLNRATEAAQQFDAHGKGGKPFLEGFEMLKGKDRRRRENRDLLAIHHDFEGRAHRYFRFPVAHIAAEEPIHRLAFLHVLLDVADSRDLVRRLFEFESIFEFALKIAVRRKRKARGGFPLRVQLEKLVRQVFQRFAHARLARVPRRAPELVELRMRAFEHPVALHQVHAFQGNVQPRILQIAQKHELAAMPVRLDLAKSFELPDAMVHVHHKIAGFELGKIAEKTGGTDFVAGALDRGRDVKQVCMTVEGQIRPVKRHAFRKRRPNEQHPGGLLRALGGKPGGRLLGFAQHIGHFVLAADVRKPFDLSGAGGGQKHAAASRQLRLHIAHASDHIAVKPRTRAGSDFELRRRADAQRELLKMNLRGLPKRCGRLLFAPEIVSSRR